MALDDERASTPFGQAELEALFVKFERSVFNVVYRWVWSRDEARDVTQEAFLRLWDARRRIRPETVEPLLFRTALNLAANRRRRAKLRSMVSFGVWSEEQSVDDPSASLEQRQRDATVRRAVNALPEKLKVVVMLSEFSGMSTRQIAEALEIPEGTVGSRKSLAMQALAKTLGPQEALS